MFIAKYLAYCGVCSRRKAVELVKSGQVFVNNKIVKDVTYKVESQDTVMFNKKIIKPRSFVYILLNKPKEYITTVSDEKGRKTVLDLIKDKKMGRIYPVGRLDRMTTGLLLLTNDGEFAQKLSHPKYEITKGYHVVLNRDFEKTDFEKLSNGIKLEDGVIKPDSVFFTTKNSYKKITIKIHSGKNRIVRRMFECFGYRVEKLDRFLYAGLNKKGLPVGNWRLLKKSEVENLLV